MRAIDITHATAANPFNEPCIFRFFVESPLMLIHKKCNIRSAFRQLFHCRYFLTPELQAKFILRRELDQDCSNIIFASVLVGSID